MEAFAQALTLGRRRLGLSQSRMAELLQVSLRQYQRWEAATSAPRRRDRERIVAVLDAPGSTDPPDLRDKLEALREEVDGLRIELTLLKAWRNPAGGPIADQGDDAFTAQTVEH